MRYLFVSEDLRTGGAQTLMVRQCVALAERGNDVAICCSGGELLDEIGDSVTRLIYSGFLQAPDVCNDWLLASDQPATLISYDPISAGLGLLIEARNRTGRRLNHISGILHPRAWFMDSERRDRKMLNRLLASAVGFDHFFFMNEECRVDHEQRWGVDLSAGPIVPIGVTLRPATWDKAPASKLKVVSVGRLVDFKQYNVGIPSIVRQAIDQGLSIEWDIFGTGELQEEINKEIEAHGVQSAVRLHGNLPYSRLNTALLEHDAFVGLGTAALEAAMLGLPVITATDSERDRSYGFFDQLPFGNLGERQAEPPAYKILDLLRKVSALGPDQRRDLSKRMHAAARPYAIEDTVALIERFAQADLPAPALKRKKFMAGLYVSLTQGRAPILARSFRDRLRSRSATASS